MAISYHAKVPVIRPAVAADSPRLIALSASPDRARLRLRAALTGTELLLVTDTMTGTVSVRWENGCDAPHPWMYALFVREEHRRHGVGRALIAAAEAAAVARACTAMSLDVDFTNDGAIRLYEHLGYTRVRRHEHRWRAIDPETGDVTATGTADTWIMRHALRAAPELRNRPQG
jgi:ribosomal protein S18 acetylase RimI-like enzyme